MSAVKRWENQCADKHFTSEASGERKFALSCNLNPNFGHSMQTTHRHEEPDSNPLDKRGTFCGFGAVGTRVLVPSRERRIAESAFSIRKNRALRTSLGQ
jgi:hypothetical protein